VPENGKRKILTIGKIFSSLVAYKKHVYIYSEKIASMRFLFCLINQILQIFLSHLSFGYNMQHSYHIK